MPDRIHALRDKSGALYTDDASIATILNDSFQSVFTVEPVEGALPQFPDRTTARLDPSGDELYVLSDVTARQAQLDITKSMGPDGLHARVLKECATELAVPLTAIYKRSHRDGQAPSFFKQANVTAIFKKGCKVTALNYRPISLTCVACKVQEAIIHSRMLQHLVTHDLIDPAQHGFLPGMCNGVIT